MWGRKKTTKRELIIKHFRKGKSLTSWQAIHKFNYTRLAALIHTLEGKGWVFQHIKVVRDGTHWVEYVPKTKPDPKLEPSPFRAVDLRVAYEQESA